MSIHRLVFSGAILNSNMNIKDTLNGLLIILLLVKKIDFIPNIYHFGDT